MLGKVQSPLAVLATGLVRERQVPLSSSAPFLLLQCPPPCSLTVTVQSFQTPRPLPRPRGQQPAVAFLKPLRVAGTVLGSGTLHLRPGGPPVIPSSVHRATLQNPFLEGCRSPHSSQGPLCWGTLCCLSWGWRVAAHSNHGKSPTAAIGRALAPSVVRSPP